MIYEILVRPSDNSKKMTADHLIWIESNMTTRSFENWLREKSLLDGSGHAPVARWSIVQTQRPAHFNLATQAKALKGRISELMTGTPEIVAVPDASRALKAFRLKSPVQELIAA
ncbi:MAG: hypothetical protein HYR68_01045 [Burkholderiales bacterium]|nr:hypothetical protein [Burkholderiales bacterium]MBI3729277.1 hypothetical protein [Burkholderiales bacterium]